jgi:hypothetical protein
LSCLTDSFGKEVIEPVRNQIRGKPGKDHQTEEGQNYVYRYYSAHKIFCGKFNKIVNPLIEASGIYLVPIRKLRMRHYWFLIRERGIFRPGKEIEGLRGGVRWYAAQASPKIDAARAEKNRFRMETI